MNDLPTDRPSARWQFGLRAMLAVTTVSAVVASIAAALDAPLTFRATVAVYFMLLTTYGGLALARAWQRWRDVRAYRDRLRDDCRRLADDLRQRPK